MLHSSVGSATGHYVKSILPVHLVQLCSNSWGPWTPKFCHIRENMDNFVHLRPNSGDPPCRLDLITKEAGNPNSRETDQILSYLASNHPGGGWCLSSLPKFSWTSSDSCSNPHSCWFDLIRGTRNLNSSRGSNYVIFRRQPSRKMEIALIESLSLKPQCKKLKYVHIFFSCSQTM